MNVHIDDECNTTAVVDGIIGEEEVPVVVGDVVDTGLCGGENGLLLDDVFKTVFGSS